MRKQPTLGTLERKKLLGGKIFLGFLPVSGGSKSEQLQDSYLLGALGGSFFLCFLVVF